MCTCLYRCACTFLSASTYMCSRTRVCTSFSKPNIAPVSWPTSFLLTKTVFPLKGQFSRINTPLNRLFCSPEATTISVLMRNAKKLKKKKSNNNISAEKALQKKRKKIVSIHPTSITFFSRLFSLSLSFLFFQNFLSQKCCSFKRSSG